MTILSTGDWQCTLSNLDRCAVIVDQCISVLLKASRPRIFLHLGDLKHQFNPIDQRVTNFLIEAFERIKRECEDILFVRGNHDSITTQDGVPSCVPLVKLLGASAVADNDWALHVKLYSTGPLAPLRIYMVPYFRDPDRQKKAFDAAYLSCKTSPPHSTNILAFHNEITGCERSPWARGDAYTLNDIHASSYDLCLGGHIHRAQHIKPNVYYVGSPFAMDWSECNIEHRLLKIEL